MVSRLLGRRAGASSAAANTPEATAPELHECPRRWPLNLRDASCAHEGDDAEDGIRTATISAVKASYFTATNWGMRHSNEDRPVIHNDIFAPRSLPFALIGVLDGHDTAEASDLVSRELPRLFSAKLKDGQPIQEAYAATLAELEERLKTNRHASAGTCVLGCLVAGRHVWCANLGDCRAALVTLQPPMVDPKTKSLMPKVASITWMSRDHKASCPWEKERITKAGGQVVEGRVEGLEPSRTLGDFDVKMQVRKDVISIIPEVRRQELGDGGTPSQAILICATDGVWDVLTGQEVCNLIMARKEIGKFQDEVMQQLSSGFPPGPSSDPKGVLAVLAEDLVQFSIAKGSHDDCTAVVALISVGPSA